MATVLAVASILALGAGPSAELDAHDQRIELPEQGIAVTFPAGWIIARTTYLSGEDPSLVSLLTAEAPSGVVLDDWVSCSVDDTTALMPPTVDSMAELLEFIWWNREVIEAETGLAAVSTQLMELPAGEVGCVDLRDASMAAEMRDYTFTDGEAWFSVTCISNDPPADRWLSIAETFEFLPPDASTGT
jgi:hypothetical protein